LNTGGEAASTDGRRSPAVRGLTAHRHCTMTGVR